MSGFGIDLTGENPALHATDDSLRRIPFSLEDESNLRQLALLMRVSAVAAVVSGGAEAAGAVLYSGGFHFGLAVVFQVAMAAWLFRGAKAFDRVADSDEDDQGHISTAIDNLRFLFLLKSILVVTALAVLVGAVLIFALNAGK